MLIIIFFKQLFSYLSFNIKSIAQITLKMMLNKALKYLKQINPCHAELFWEKCTKIVILQNYANFMQIRWMMLMKMVSILKGKL